MASLHDWKDLAVCTVRGWIEDAAPSMGASLAFYTLFSLAPLLLVVIALAGPFVGRHEARSLVIQQVENVTGEKTAAGIEEMLDAASKRERDPVRAVVGILLMVLGATTVFAELRSDLNRIWRCKPPATGGVMKFLRTRFASFSLLMVAGALLLASVAATAWLTWMAKVLFPGVGWLVRTGEFAISFCVVTGLFAGIYKLLPAARIEWRDVWVGAAVTAVLFWIGKLLIAVYIAKAAVGSTFGAAQATVVLIAWVYYTSQVFLLGAEFTRHYALRHGSLRAGSDPGFSATP